MVSVAVVINHVYCVMVSPLSCYCVLLCPLGTLETRRRFSSVHCCTLFGPTLDSAASWHINSLARLFICGAL